MTDKPEITIEEKASQLAGWITNPSFMKKHFVDAITEAHERGRRDGLEDAAHFAWECELGGKPYKELPKAIRSLIEKEPTK